MERVRKAAACGARQEAKAKDLGGRKNKKELCGSFSRLRQLCFLGAPN